jgi:hypothetical protein
MGGRLDYNKTGSAASHLIYNRVAIRFTSFGTPVENLAIKQQKPSRRVFAGNIQRRKSGMNKISSGLKTLFLVHFIAALVFGLLQLLIPGMFFRWFGMSIKDALPYRIVGAAVLAFAASSWLCYKAAEWNKVKIVVQAEIVWASLAALVSLYGVLFAGMPATMWIQVIIMAGFAAAFIYYYTKK